MKIVMETTIGDAHVSITHGDYRTKTAHQMKMAAAMPASGTPDASNVAAFIGLLSNLGSTDLDRLTGRLPAAPLPTGYRHFRLFDAATGAEWHSSFVFEENRTHTLHDVLFGALNHPTLELSAWTATEWLPDMLPGVLDLELTFTTRPRTKPMRLKMLP